VLLVQGSGFNWPAPDHFRLVFLPHEDDLRDAIARIARFLAGYRQRAGNRAGRRGRLTSPIGTLQSPILSTTLTA
jgi:hypothetical protein